MNGNISSTAFSIPFHFHFRFECEWIKHSDSHKDASSLEIFFTILDSEQDACHSASGKMLYLFECLHVEIQRPKKTESTEERVGLLFLFGLSLFYVGLVLFFFLFFGLRCVTWFVCIRIMQKRTAHHEHMNRTVSVWELKVGNAIFYSPAPIQLPTKYVTRIHFSVSFWCIDYPLTGLLLLRSI